MTPASSPHDSVLASPWNNAVSSLEMLIGSQSLGVASGFFWRRRQRAYLITNWHVLSARHPDSRQPCHTSSALPDTLKYTAFKHLATVDDKVRRIQVIHLRWRLWRDGGPT